MKKRVKAAMGRLAEFAGLYRRTFRSRMTVVAFHRVNDWMADDALTCGAFKFEAFCDFFARNFRVVPLVDQIHNCRSGQDMGGTLSITFDDGYLDNFEVAAPILKRRNLPATFFVTTGFVGTHTTPSWDSKLDTHPGWMSWQQIRELARQGFHIGSHTDTHIDMALSDPDTVRRELSLSKRKIEEAVGASATLFAYPFGGREHMSDDSLELVREAGFICSASCHGGLNRLPLDPFRIRRLPIADWYASPHQFGFEIATTANL
jgi:peptidoglycan/xylan/chitin deacetylase (PgdA/CDA1 family)